MSYKMMLSLSLLIGSAFLISFSYIGLNVVEIKSPAGPRSSEPNLHKGIDGKIYLTWIETRDENKTSLYYSTLENNKWIKPTMISEGENWFVNWADFPSISTFGNGSLASHFLVENGSGSYAYDVHISISNDGGSSWGKPITPHLDYTKTEHGFVSLLPSTDDRLLLVWLDGRNFSEHDGHQASAVKEMTLRSATINKNGEISNEFLLDDRVCECCQTDAALTENGPIVVYRNRSENEIRDISFVRFINGAWTTPQVLFNDNWHIAGCPVNGPAIEAKDNLVAVAWFTAANKSSKIKLAFSTNAGRTFAEPIIINEGNPWGRVDVILLHDGSALVSWLESSVNRTVIKARRVKKGGSLDSSFVVAESSKSRSSGFPKMVEKNNRIYFTWTEVGKTLSIRTAYLNLGYTY